MKTCGALGLALAALAAGSLAAPPALAGEEVRLYTNADLAKYADFAVPATPGTGSAAASRPTFAEDWAFVERHLEREAARLEELRRHQLELDHVAIDEAYDQGRWAGHLALATGRGLRVVDHGVGRHHDPDPGPMAAPAEVDVVAEDRQPRVEAVEVLPHVAAHQHPGGADRENVADLVVLALVELARFDPGVATAAERGGDSDF